MCFTKGQWFERKTTRSASASEVSGSETVFPVAGSVSSNAGARVPSGTIVDGTLTMALYLRIPKDDLMTPRTQQPATG